MADFLPRKMTRYARLCVVPLLGFPLRWETSASDTATFAFAIASQVARCGTLPTQPYLTYSASRKSLGIPALSEECETSHVERTACFLHQNLSQRRIISCTPTIRLCSAERSTRSERRRRQPGRPGVPMRAERPRARWAAHTQPDLTGVRCGLVAPPLNAPAS